MYLTTDRDKAAVFTWKQWNLRDDGIRMQETPLRWINHIVSQKEWIYLKPKEVLSSEAVRHNVRYKFDTEDNALYEIKKISGGSKPKKHKTFVGTWTVHLDGGSIKKIGSKLCAN